MLNAQRGTRLLRNPLANGRLRWIRFRHRSKSETGISPLVVVKTFKIELIPAENEQNPSESVYHVTLDEPPPSGSSIELLLVPF